MHLTHIRFKPTKQIEKDFDFTDALKDIEVPEEGKNVSRKFYKTKKLSDEIGFDLMLEYDDSVIYGFDFLHEKNKVIIPELNPTIIFYSNAVMFHRNLIKSRDILLEQSPTIKNFNKPVDPKVFGIFFQFAVNCIINLQATIESLANRIILENEKYKDEEDSSIFRKIDNLLPEITEKSFKKHRKGDNYRVRKIIELRNKIIHLTPVKETNTQYKFLYRKIIKFDYSRSLIAVRKFVNFYEPNLLEECPCGKEYYYDLEIKDKD